MSYKFKIRITAKGFTLTELMVGLSIGIVVLTGLMSFYFRSSKIIGEQQSVIKDLNQLQFVINKIVQDIKESNTQAPGTGSSSVTPSMWGALPYMGHGRTFNPDLSSYQPSLVYPKEFPTYPVAYNFPVYQSGKTGTSEGWYPRQDPNTEINDLTRECNQLVFYKVKDNKIIRIMYYTDPLTTYPLNPLQLYKLKRRVQMQPISTGVILKDNDSTSQESTILSDVKFIQFSYPLLTQKLSTPSDPEYNSNLYDLNLRTKLIDLISTEPDAQKIPYLQSILMNEFRNNIKIRVAIAGPQIGNKRTTAFELSTEVMVRN